MNAQALGQFANVCPPELGKTLAITLDTTSRAKDLGTLDIGGAKVERGGTMYLTMQANAEWYYAFSNATGTILETSADAAAAAITFRADGCARAVSGEIVRVRVDRVRHRFLIVKGAAAGILRVWVSSDGTTR